MRQFFADYLSFDHSEPAIDVSGRVSPGKVFFVKVRGDAREQPAPTIQQQISAKAEAALEDAEAAGVISEILEAVAGEIVEAAQSKVMKMGGIRVRVRGAVMGRDHNHLGSRFGDAVNFRHHTKDVRLVFEKMGKVNPMGAITGERPWKARKVRPYVCF